MKKLDLESKSFVFVSHAGCFLPFLIMFNFLFGWMFFKLSQWLLIELVLILLFIASSVIMTKKILSGSPKRHGVIDVEAEVVEDKKQIK